MLSICLGPAADSLKQMAEEGKEKFEFVFMDADKTNYKTYLKVSFTNFSPVDLLFKQFIIISTLWRVCWHQTA